jgi:uncharacterized protein YraI
MRSLSKNSGLALGFILALGVMLAVPGAAQAKPAYAVSTVNLRAAPGTTNEILAKIPSGSLIDADNCTNGWCAVTWQGKSGFAIQSALDLSGRVPPRRTVRRIYRDEPDYVEEPPVYYEPPPVYVRPYYRSWGWGWHHHHW